mgnify:CR=1 FL=1
MVEGKRCIMKKIILILTVFLFTCMGASATVSVHYNNAGAPVSVTYGAGRPMSMAQAAQYSANHRPHPVVHRPRPFVGYGYSNGHMGPYVGIQQPIVDGSNNHYTISTRKSISRLSKNYKVPMPPKTHTYGGLTYYY